MNCAGSKGTFGRDFPKTSLVCLLGLLYSAFCFAPKLAVAGEVAQDGDMEYISKFQDARNRQFPRQFRAFKLTNGLEVLVIEDPAAKQASVSMSVAIGFLMDPPEYRGMAHYLEHMLFLGTEKYPKVEEYHQFIKQNGGSSNAYTWLDHTNYHFVINSSVLEEAIDRFAHFFIDPVFNEKFIPKELENIDSEYKKNVNDNGFRNFHVSNILANPEHPQSRVFQGSSETLGSVSKEALIKYYKENYSAERMRLVVISPNSADQISEWVTSKFSKVPVSETPVPMVRASVYQDEALPRLIEVKPVGKQRSLKLMFQIPSWYDYLYSSPHALVSEVIQRTDEGSLNQILKDKGWITGLSVRMSERRELAFFEVNFRLSEGGMGNWKEICSEFFKYVAFLKSESLGKERFSQSQRLGELDFVFKTPGNDSDAAIEFANKMHYIPAAEIEAMRDLLITYQPETYQMLLKLLAPEKVQIFLSADELSHAKHEDFYGIDYRVSALSTEDVLLWKSATPSAEMRSAPLNPFVPAETALEGVHQDEPTLVQEDEKSRILIQTDHTFQKPSAKVRFEIQTLKVVSLENAALKEVYQLALQRSNLKWILPASRAGYNVDFSADAIGYVLEFSGYTDKLLKFAKEYIQHLGEIQLSELEFANLKEELVRGIENKRFGKAYEVGIERLEVLRNPSEFPKTDLVPLIKKLTLDQVRDFAKGMFREVFVLGYAFGNITASVPTQIVEEFYKSTGAKPLEKSLRPKRETFKFPDGKAYFHKTQLAGKNHAWVLNYQFGETTPEMEAALNIGDSILETPFFDEMRTQRTLGYIVNVRSYLGLLASGLRFVIQSDRPVTEVAAAAEEWIGNISKVIASVPAEEFRQIKGALIEQMEQKLSTFEKKYFHSLKSIFWYDEDYLWKQKRLKVLAEMKQEEVVRLFDTALNPLKHRKLTVFAMGDDGVKSEIVRPEETEILDLGVFKGSLDRYQQVR